MIYISPTSMDMSFGEHHPQSLQLWSFVRMTSVVVMTSGLERQSKAEKPCDCLGCHRPFQAFSHKKIVEIQYAFLFVIISRGFVDRKRMVNIDLAIFILKKK